MIKQIIPFGIALLMFSCGAGSKKDEAATSAAPSEAAKKTEKKAEVNDPNFYPIDKTFEGKWAARKPTPKNKDFGIPVEKNALWDYLQSKEYHKFPSKESKIHPSGGPHKSVLVFANDIVTKSMAAGNDNHPEGSIIIKEMYEDDNKTPYGFSVMVKTGSAKSDWYWAETTSVTDKSKFLTSGNNVSGCAGCHAIGQGMVRIDFPLK